MYQKAMTNRKTRVLHITSSLGIGGAETMLFRLVRELQERDDQTHSIITLTNDVKFDFAKIGVHVDVLDLKKTTNFLLGFFKLRKMIHAYKPDVIQGWMYHGNLASTIASPVGVPVFWGIHHSLHDLKHEKLGIRLLIKAGAILGCQSKTKKIIFCSENSKRHHNDIGYPIEKSIVIPNGFDCVEFSPSEKSRLITRGNLGFHEDHLVIGNFGRYHPVKDHELLLHAFSDLLLSLPMARLVLAGSGMTEDNANLYDLICKLGINERVKLLGQRNDMPDLFNAIDVYALSSKSEAFPNVLGEASACGVPSVTTNVGDASLIVGSSGCVVAPGSMASLRDALRQILVLCRSERVSLGDRARQDVVDNFSLPVVADAYADLYVN